jgi:hypothetical protein
VVGVEVDPVPRRCGRKDFRDTGALAVQGPAQDRDVGAKGDTDT